MDKVAIQHFLLVFDHQREKLVHEESFGTDGRRAVEAYQACEMLNRNKPHIDIVLIGSDSIETVRLTHANYYSGEAAGAKVKSKYLAGL